MNMMDPIGMILSLPKNYEETLKKLALYFLLFSYISTYMLRCVPQIDNLARGFEEAITANIPHDVSIRGLYEWILVALFALNPAGILLAALLTLVAYVSQLHDRLSDLFGIRRRFDVSSILLPLAVLVGAKLDASRLKRLETTDRDRLMRSVFYRYASSTAEKPLVDRHDIQHALSAWSWFWVMVEGTTIAVTSYAVAAAFGAWKIASLFGGAAIGALLVGALLYSRLERYARPQIECIASDEIAAAAVREEFNAL